MHTLPAFKTGKPRVEQGYVQPLDGIDIPFTIIEGIALSRWPPRPGFDFDTR